MKYENARDVLPEWLLKQVQKYVSGRLLYIPAREKKRQWGTVSGGQQYLQERNRCIRSQFAKGEAIEALADEYHLSCESIKRIVYNRKEMTKMTHRGTLSSAQEWARHNMLEEWVHQYLLSDGHNKPFSDGLKMVDRLFLGPFRMPVALFRRCAGPAEEGLPYQIHSETWEKHVSELMEAIRQKRDLPPLIVHYWIPEGKTEGEFELNDGNHRWEAYARLGIEEADVIVWITDRDEHEQFTERFSMYGK